MVSRAQFVKAFYTLHWNKDWGTRLNGQRSLITTSNLFMRLTEILFQLDPGKKLELVKILLRIPNSQLRDSKQDVRLKVAGIKVIITCSRWAGELHRRDQVPALLCRSLGNILLPPVCSRLAKGAAWTLFVCGFIVHTRTDGLFHVLMASFVAVLKGRRSKNWPIFTLLSCVYSCYSGWTVSTETNLRQICVEKLSMIMARRIGACLRG